MSRRALAVFLTTAAFFALLVFAAPARGGGGGCSAPVTDEATTTVRMRGLCFTPTIVHVRKGGEITWVNRDRDRHNLAGANYQWGSRTLRFKDSITFRFTEKGTYPYLCQYHPGMIGAVVVGNGKATESLTWRDKAVKQTDFDRHERRDRDEGKAAAFAFPSDHDPDALAGGRLSGRAPVTAATDVWPAEWFVVLGAALLACVGTVLLAGRRGPRRYETSNP